MTISLGTPRPDELAGIVQVLRQWQVDGATMQLHPGDVGWFWRFGAAATAAALRTWARDGAILAVGLLDGPALLRLTTAPDVHRDEELAQQLRADLTSPQRAVLPDGPVSLDAPAGALVQELLVDVGWREGEPWTPLRRGLEQPVPDPGLRVEVVGPATVAVRVAVQRASFATSTFTPRRWHAMAAGRPYQDARCLLAYDDRGEAVAAATVWSAGPGRPGLIEPLGVHRDHRGRGHGRQLTAAAAAALARLGSSSAVVCTPSSNVAAVSTYESAGFQRLAEVRDLRRPA